MWVPIVVTNRVGDRGTDSFAKRIPSSHDALELGELVDDQRLEVGLAELGRLGRSGRVGSNAFRKRAGDAFDASSLLAHRSELRLEDHRIELGKSVAQWSFAVLLDEEARVSQARPKNAIVSLCDGDWVDRGVDDVEVGGHQRSLGRLPHCKVPLVVPHDGNDDLFGKLEKAVVERARNDERFFDQGDALVGEKRVRLHHSAERRCGFLERA